MISIQEALTSISLEKYSEAFVASGYSNLASLLSLSQLDLDKALTDMGMLKGHTFKLKKMIEDAKMGILPKPQPAQVSQPIAKPPINKVNVEPAVQSKPEAAKTHDKIKKDAAADKAGNSKTQSGNIIQTRVSLIASLKQFLDIDLEPYFQALAQLKSMQASVKEMIQTDVEMVNNYS